MLAVAYLIESADAWIGVCMRECSQTGPYLTVYCAIVGDVSLAAVGSVPVCGDGELSVWQCNIAKHYIVWKHLGTISFI